MVEKIYVSVEAEEYRPNEFEIMARLGFHNELPPENVPKKRNCSNCDEKCENCIRDK